MTACKVELVLPYVAAPSIVIIRHANTTGQMGYQMLYFENSTYKYYVRKHMQVLKIQKRLTKNISAQEWQSDCYRLGASLL